MSIALQLRLQELERKCGQLEDLLRKTIEHMPKNGSDTNAGLEIRVRTLENNYKMMNARMAKGVS